MICTRDRLAELDRALGSLASATRPRQTELVWIVVDNASPPQEAEIRALAANHGLTIEYAHEPRRGYASPRNRALEVALAAGADCLLFVDDDVLAEPQLLVRHMEALASEAVDVSMGGQTGKPIGAAPRLRKSKVATFNVAFKRWLIEPPPGAGLRFDERLNLTGYEDHEFFYEAQASGARVTRNGEARVTMCDSKASITQKSMSDDLVARYVYATGRNWSYVRRLRYGKPYTLAASVWTLTSKLGRLGFNTPLVRVLTPFAPQLAKRARRQVIMDRAFISGLLHGLSGTGVERAAAKRGEIVEIVEDHARGAQR